MTDVPRRFPYGGGPRKRIEERAERLGAEIQDLPSLNDPVYAEPAYDVAVDDGSPSVPDEPGTEASDLDFDAAFPVLVGPALTIGVPAAEHLEHDTFRFHSWECDCKANAKTGIPSRHYVQHLGQGRTSRHGTTWTVMIAPGKGEVKQVKGEGFSGRTPWMECSTWVSTEITLRGWNCSCPDKNDHRWDRQYTSRHGTPGAVMRPDYAALQFENSKEAPVGLASAECRTWRPAVRQWTRPARDWTKLAPSLQSRSRPDPPPPPVADPAHPAGPVEPPTVLTLADLPPRCTAKTFMARGWTTSQLKVRGRIVDDGSVMVQFRLSGSRNGRNFVAWWTDGKFSSAMINRRSVNLTELRRFLKDEE